MSVSYPVADPELVAEFKALLAENLDKRFTEFRTETERRIKELSARGPGGIPHMSPGSPIETPGTKFIASAEFQRWAASPGQRGRVTVAVPFTKATALTN